MGVVVRGGSGRDIHSPRGTENHSFVPVLPRRTGFHYHTDSRVNLLKKQHSNNQ